MLVRFTMALTDGNDRYKLGAEIWIESAAVISVRPLARAQPFAVSELLYGPGRTIHLVGAPEDLRDEIEAAKSCPI